MGAGTQPTLEQLFQNADGTPFFTGRQFELEDIDEALTKLRLAEIVGSIGSGKTTLAEMYAHRRQDRYANRVIKYQGYSGAGLTGYVESIVKGLRTIDGPVLLIIDSAELLDPNDILQAISQIENGPWLVHFLIVSRIRLGIGTQISINGLVYEPFRNLLRHAVGPAINDEEVERVWRDTEGSPQLLKALIGAWHLDRSRPIGDLGELFEPFTRPGILGPNGQPLGRRSAGQRRIAERVQVVTNDMLRRLAVRPELVYELEPHQFEELAAELFERKGFTVTLTPRTRDGGKDLYLAQSNELGSFRYAVECKRYAPDRAVSIDVVQRLAGVVDAERLTAGIVLTTSRFSRDAIDQAAKIRYRMSLRAYAELKAMLEAAD